jgi:hypothetical protein
MNKKQLLGLGVPSDCVSEAIGCIQVAARIKDKEAPKKVIPKIVLNPEIYLADTHYGKFAQALINFRKNDLPLEEIGYRSWGRILMRLPFNKFETHVNCPLPGRLR